MLDDQQLLHQYATDHSESAFADLVSRHVNLVYSTALRRMNGDAHLSQDVAQRVFISVPNRFFPVEHHTALPVALYGDGLFRMACRVAGKSKWAQEENLILMTRKRLWRLAAQIEKSTAVGYTGLHLGPFSSNLYLAFH